jgi:hypothetical protein
MVMVMVMLTMKWLKKRMGQWYIHRSQGVDQCTVMMGLAGGACNECKYAMREMVGMVWVYLLA